MGLSSIECPPSKIRSVPLDDQLSRCSTSTAKILPRGARASSATRSLRPNVGRMTPAPIRCAWADSGDPLYAAYHDDEWGVPERDSRALWEKLVLDGFQAGLSWSIILRKRDAFREAFKGFDPSVVARFGALDIDRLMENPGIVRSRA